jgi:hypothetical protein
MENQCVFSFIQPVLIECLLSTRPNFIARDLAINKTKALAPLSLLYSRGKRLQMQGGKGKHQKRKDWHNYWGMVGKI